jgi:type IX secretion system PorP/SprF family membrane protein
MKLKFKQIVYSGTLMVFVALQSYAQQDPQFTQYMYNMSVINPAYATDDPTAINFGLLYRSQWNSAVGGPETGTFFGHATFGKRVEGGLSVVHDEIGGVVKNTSVFADFAYVLPISERTKLSLGIKAGASFFITNFDGFVFSDPLPDPTFANNISEVFPNVGFGMYYFSDQFYVGFSAPNLLETEYLDNDSGVVAQGSENIHYFLTGGYVFNLSERVKLKPAFMMKAVANAPLSVDLTANTLLYERVELGIGYRFDDSYAVMGNFRILPSVRIGYVYEQTTSNLGRFNSGTHEFLLLFDLSRIGGGYDKSPRFF